MNSCAIGSLTYDYAYLLKNGRKSAGNLFCKLSWLIYAKPVIDSYIPVGTLISDEGEPACGRTNTVVGFAPAPSVLIVNYQLITFEYNGNPIAIVVPDYGTIQALMDSVVASLTTASGTQWSWTQISEFEFLLCTDYTQNGDTVDIVIEAFFETSLGFITMNVTLFGGIAPETPEYQTAAMNCITAAQYEQMIETWNGFTCSVKCCDIPKPSVVICVSDSDGENIELREDNNLEIREEGN